MGGTVATRSPLAWDGLLNRRDLLRVGAVGASALLVPSAFARPQMAAAKAKSVILLWMAGGVTHIDSFDPKPDAPKEIRGTLTAIQTGLPGVRFSEVMPCLARQTHQFALLRSYAHGNDDHFLSQAWALSGRRVTMSQITTEPNVGSIVAKLLGPRAGFPGYIAVPGTTRPGPPPTNEFTGGWLGREFDPFCTGGKPRHEDFTARVREADEDEFHKQALNYAFDMNSARMAGRQSLRQRLEEGLRRSEKQPTGDALARHYQGAFAMLTSPAVRRAFELAEEPATVRERFGRTKIGTRCLLARRLVEAGARYVMVDYGYDPEYGNLWDNHNAPVQKHPPICEMAKLPYHLTGADRACAALLADLETRGLLGQTLVVFLTEFGRTPKINSNGGRDHWGAAGSIFFAGGGVRGGQVVGATDKHAAHPTTPPHGPGDVAATIYEALGIDWEALLRDRQDRPVPVLPEGRPIPGLF
jgi:hypothetical protein